MNIIEFTEKYNTFYSPLHDWVKECTLLYYERDFLNSLMDNKFTINLHSRQMNITQLMAAYAAYNLIFGDEESIVYLSCKNDLSKRFVERVRLIIQNYIEKNNLKEDEFIAINNQQKIVLCNGNIFAGKSATIDATRGYTLTKLLIDNAGHIDNLEVIYSALIPSLASRNSNIHMAGQPNGITFFTKLATEDNNYKKLKYHYTLNPIRFNPENIKMIRKNISNEKLWQEEMELKFIEVDKPNKRNIVQFRIPDTLYNDVAKRLMELDCSLSDYMRRLIEKDLQPSK